MGGRRIQSTKKAGHRSSELIFRGFDLIWDKVETLEIYHLSIHRGSLLDNFHGFLQK